MNQLLSRLTRVVTDLGRQPDGQLLVAFLDRADEAAFEVLVRRHGPMVLAVCRRLLRHHQDAEDAFQATFLILARKAADVWPRDAVGSWLYGVATRVALKARAVRARKLGREQPLAEFGRVPHEPDPDLAEVIDRAVRKLPEVYRAAVVACDLEGLSRKDAAEQLGWKEGTLSGRLCRARQLLAARLQKAGVTVPAAGLVAMLDPGREVRAGLITETLKLAGSNFTAGVSAPVAALTEGVVRSMFLMKVQSATVAAVAACAVTFGVWGVATGGDGPGVGDGDGPGGTQPKPTVVVKPGTGSDADAVKVLEQIADLEAKLATLKKTQAKGQPTEKPAEVELRVKQAEVELRVMQAEAQLRAATAALEKARAELDAAKATGQPPAKPLPPLPRVEKPAQPPAEWKVKPEADLKLEDLKKYLADLEVRLKTKPTDDLQKQLEELREKLEALKKMAAESKKPGWVDKLKQPVPPTPGTPPVKPTDPAKPATDPKPAVDKWDLEKGVLAKLLTDQARVMVTEARARVDAARAQVAVAQANFDRAMAMLKEAEDKLAVAMREAEEAARKTVPGRSPPTTKSPVKAGEVTVHVRTATAAEKVVTLMATGDTVLDALKRAGGEAGFKMDAASVWVVRDNAILTVDLEAIKKGDAKTNYPLQAGDKVFIQAKVAK